MSDLSSGDAVTTAAGEAATAHQDGRSVVRAVAVLDYVASRASSTPPGVVEIARAVGREKSVVSRNLRILVQAGMLVRDPVGLGYRIGPRLFQIAAGAHDPLLVELSERAVAALADRFGERAEVHRRAGNVVTTIATASPDCRLQVVGWLGRTYSLTSSAAGRALLLDAGDDDVRRLVETAGVGAGGPQAPQCLDDVLDRLSIDRQRGVSVAVEEGDRDLVAVAAPIRSAQGRAAASIMIAGPHERMRSGLDAVAAALLESAAGISIALGHLPAGPPAVPPSSQPPEVRL